MNEAYESLLRKTIQDFKISQKTILAEILQLKWRALASVSHPREESYLLLKVAIAPLTKLFMEL